MGKNILNLVLIWEEVNLIPTWIYRVQMHLCLNTPFRVCLRAGNLLLILTSYLMIWNLSLSLHQFQWTNALGSWKDIFNERCYWNYLLLTNSRKIWNGVKMVAIAPISFVIYLPFIRFLYFKLVWGYCFIHSKGNARSQSVG